MKHSFLFLYTITYYTSIIQILCNPISVILLSSSISIHKQNTHTTPLHSTSSLAFYYNKLCIISFCFTITFITVLSLSITCMKRNSKQKASSIGLLLCSRLIYIFNVLSSFLLEYYSIG